MFKAALYVEGRVVIADSHLEAYQRLTSDEQNSSLVSGFYDPSTGEFCSDCEKDHFYEKELFLVRHGQACPSDSPDPELSPEGVRQAEMAARRLAAFDLTDFVGVTSPFLRCLRTTEILARILRLKFTVLPSLAETATLTENQTVVHNRRSQFPQFTWETTEDWTFAPESDSQVRGRSCHVLQEMPSKAIVVSHYGFICNMVRLALCDDKADRIIAGGIAPASVTRINNDNFEQIR